MGSSLTKSNKKDDLKKVADGAISLLEVVFETVDNKTGKKKVHKKTIKGTPEEVSTEFKSLKDNRIHFIKHHYFFDEDSKVKALISAKHYHVDGVDTL